MMQIIRTVIFCGRQGLALRCYQDYTEFDIDDEPKENKGNFRSLFRLRVKLRDIILKKYFENCGENCICISWKIQNQITETCDSIIKQKIDTEVNSAKCFKVQADKTCNISTIE